jgi:hypothetical protein
VVRCRETEGGTTGGDLAVTPLRLRLVWLCVLGGATLLVSCNRPPQQTEAPTEEMYFPIEGSVGFDILPAGGAGVWSALYVDADGKTTRFRIELGPATSSAAGPPSGHGKFLAEPGSDPIPLLESLKPALQAKHIPRSVQKVDALPFEFVVLAEHQSRSPQGLNGNPKGNWTALKISFPNGKGRMLLNLNAVAHKAEFSMENPAEGDRVLAELAKVL